MKEKLLEVGCVGSVLNVVGGSSGYIRKENSRVRASLSLSIDPTTSNANEYQLASSPVNINISAANVDDVDDADDIEIAEFPNQHEYLYQQLGTSLRYYGESNLP
jgi:hypothetical protein